MEGLLQMSQQDQQSFVVFEHWYMCHIPNQYTLPDMQGFLQERYVFACKLRVIHAIILVILQFQQPWVTHKIMESC